jgi:hypothetical protein
LLLVDDTGPIAVQAWMSPCIPFLVEEVIEFPVLRREVLLAIPFLEELCVPGARVLFFFGLTVAKAIWRDLGYWRLRC